MQRPDEPVVGHLDLDAFFAAIEQRDNPRYRGKPLVVGAIPPSRGVVSTCSYEARKYGIRSAMPVSRAARLCPDAIFVPPRIGVYADISEAIFTQLTGYVAEVQQVSIDEAFLNLTGMIPLYPSYKDIGFQIKKMISSHFGLTVSIGIASCKMLAKMASEACKPDGLLILEPEKENEFIDGMPLQKIPGFGKKTVEQFARFNIRKFADLYRYDIEFLRSKFGNTIDHFYYRRYRDQPFADEEPKSRSISTETTFQDDIPFGSEIRYVIDDMAQVLAVRLRKERSKVRTVGVKLRDANFVTYQKQRTLPNATFDGSEIGACALRLASELYKERCGRELVRLIGIRLSSFDGEQELVFPEDTRKDSLLLTIDSINEKFGRNVIKKGLKAKDGDR